MFKEMRRKDKVMTEQSCSDLLTSCEYGVLGTIDQNGYPYLTPLNYVYYNNKIYFHSATKGGKLDNIQANDKVSFCVVDDVLLLRAEFDTDYKSVIAFGRSYEAEADEKKEVLKAIIAKYSKDFIEEGNKYIEKSYSTTRVFGINIEHITGKYQDSSGSKHQK
jgi:nitroimidazol reductase NimA-like FMN-containing flavoprotein (pyridoxamine 5'-phosphate oxidase superfamily)